MDASEEDKKNYIKDNLVNKGYNMNTFCQFLCRKSGQTEFDINKFTMGEIREGVQEFTNSTPMGRPSEDSAPPIAPKPEKKEKIKNIFNSILGLKKNTKKEETQKNDENNTENDGKIEKPEEKKDEKNYDYGFRLPDKMKCQNVEETEISKFDDLPIKIGGVEKKGKSILKKSITYFTTITDPLNKIVKRSFDDFEWLRLKLTKMFDSNFIPSLPKMNPILGIENEDATMRSIEKFMHYLSLDPIIKNSQILYDFLSIENYDDFIKKKKDYEVITPCNDIQDFKSITGEIDVGFDDEKEKRFKTIKEFCSINSRLLDRLNSNLNSLYQEMNTVIRRVNEISLIWGDLYKTSEKYNDDDISKEIYIQMNKFFGNLTDNYRKQNDFMSVDIKESFIFMQHNYVSINELIKRIESKQKVYFKEEKVLIGLKEDLFKTRNTPGHKLKNADIDVDKKNDLGEFDLSSLLPLNTKALLDMKKSYGFYLNRFLKEYDRMKRLNSVIYKEKIKRCYKTHNDIASELCACVENLMSSMDVYTDTPTGKMIEKPKPNKNEINENKNNNENENKNNENKINEEKENKINENKKDEDNFNLINEDNNNIINDNNENNENKINDNENKINENKINE